MLKGFLISLFSLFLFLWITFSIAEKIFSEDFLTKIIRNTTSDFIKNEMKKYNITENQFKESVCQFTTKISLNISDKPIEIDCNEFQNFDEFISLLSSRILKNIEPKCKDLKECMEKKDFSIFLKLDFEKFKLYSIVLSMVFLSIFIVISRNLKEITRKTGISILSNSLLIYIFTIFPFQDFVKIPFQIDISEILIYTRELVFPLIVLSIFLIVVSFIFKEKKQK